MIFTAEVKRLVFEGRAMLLFLIGEFED